jgi:hypothetical protein
MKLSMGNPVIWVRSLLAKLSKGQSPSDSPTITLSENKDIEMQEIMEDTVEEEEERPTVFNGNPGLYFKCQNLY